MYAVRPRPVQGPQGLVVQRGRRDPDARRGGAEAEAGQQRAQGVPPITLGLRHREDQDQPAVRGGGTWPGPDPVVALPQHLQRSRARARSRPGRPGCAASRMPRRFSRDTEDRTAAESAPRSAISGDQRRDRQPVALLAGVEAVQRQDQLPRRDLHEPTASSRSRNRCSLPVAVRGSASMNSTARGYLYGAICALAKSCSCAPSRRRRRPRRRQDHERLDQRAPGLVRHADHGALGDLGVLEQRLLHLGCGDVVARGDDHVVAAGLVVEVAVLVAA